MTSLTLATLDNDSVENNTEQINKLFPKCRPRSDVNLNPIILHQHQQHQHQQQQQQQLQHDGTSDSPINIISTERSSDRIIEIAGGREIYSQNRIKAARKARNPSNAANNTLSVATIPIAANGTTIAVDPADLHDTTGKPKHTFPHLYKSPTRQNGNVWELRAQDALGASAVRVDNRKAVLRSNESAATAPANPPGIVAHDLTETVFASEVVMTRGHEDDKSSSSGGGGPLSDRNLDQLEPPIAPLDKCPDTADNATASNAAVVVFDDIDENNGCWYHDDKLVDVMMDNEQQLHHRMFRQRQQQQQYLNGLDLRMDVEAQAAAEVVYQTDGLMDVVQESRAQKVPDHHRDSRRLSDYPDNVYRDQQVIGNLSIAVYEGSPRRYGYRQGCDTGAVKRDMSPMEGAEGAHVSRHSSNSSSSAGSSASSGAVAKRDRDDQSQSMHHATNVLYMPRPGFPQRVLYSTAIGGNGGGCNITRPAAERNGSAACAGSGLYVEQKQAQYVEQKQAQAQYVEQKQAQAQYVEQKQAQAQYVEQKQAQAQAQSQQMLGQNTLHAHNSPTMEDTNTIAQTTSASIPCISTSTSATFDYLYEFSETRKVLEEFFKCPAPDADADIASDERQCDIERDNDDDDDDDDDVGSNAEVDDEDIVGGKLNFEFQELEYELRRQARTGLDGSSGNGLYVGEAMMSATENAVGSDSGNAYVGQRLAKARIDGGNDGAEFCSLHSEASPSPIKHQIIHDHETTEHENNFLDLSIGTGSSGDLGETEVGLQVGHSRNFTLSPETTDCDSNCGDLDSEVSLMLMDNELGPASGFLGSSGDLVLPGDSLRLYSSMPVLEDGLSSGHASDTDNNNPTVRLMKKQITEIERELSAQTTGGNSKTKLTNSMTERIQENGLMGGSITGAGLVIRTGLSPKNESCSPINGCSSNSYESNHMSQMDSLDKTPPPPAPVPHRCDSGISSGETELMVSGALMVLPTSATTKSNSSSISGNSNSNVVIVDPLLTGNSSNSAVEAAIKDIRLTLQRTKTLPLKCHNGVLNGEEMVGADDCHSPDRLGMVAVGDSERDDVKDPRGSLNMASPVWVPRQRDLSSVNITTDVDHKVQSSEEGGDEEEADTDLETDRLLGQQRTDDQGFYDEKEWRKPAKCRTLLSAATSTAASTLSALQHHYNPNNNGNNNNNNHPYTQYFHHNTPPTSLLPNNNHNHHHLVDDDDDEEEEDDGDAPDDDDDEDEDTGAEMAVTPSSAVFLDVTGASSAPGGGSVSPLLLGGGGSKATAAIKSAILGTLSAAAGAATAATAAEGDGAAVASADSDHSSHKSDENGSQKATSSTVAKPKKDKESKKKGRNKEGFYDPEVLIEGVLFRARYLGSTQLVCEGQPTKTTRMMQAEEAVSRIKEGGEYRHHLHHDHHHHHRHQHMFDDYVAVPVTGSILCANEPANPTAASNERKERLWRENNDSDTDSSSAPERTYPNDPRPPLTAANVSLVGQFANQAQTNALARGN